jgi:hypothetical protein
MKSLHIFKSYPFFSAWQSVTDAFLLSASGNRLWISSYIIAASLLLIGRLGLFPLGPPATVAHLLATISIILLLVLSIVVAVRFTLRPSWTVLVLVIMITVADAGLVTSVTYFSLRDLLLGPLATWLVAVSLALLFGLLGRFSTFHEDLVPRISRSWKIYLDVFAGTLLFMTGVSLLSFIPDRALLEARFAKLSVLDPNARLPELLDLIFTNFPYDPGLWGARLRAGSSLTKTKNLFSISYVFFVIVVFAVWTRKRITARNGSGFAESLRIPSRIRRDDPDRLLQLQSSLTFLFSFAGISFLFGLHAPLLYTGTALNWDLLILFAFFLIGGVGTWATSLELAALRGFWFVTGFLGGTLLIYLPTSTIGFLLAAFVIPPMSAAELYALRLTLQVSVGVFLLFTSFLLTGIARGPVDILKYTTALGLPLIFVGFGIPRVTAWWPFSYLLNPSIQLVAFLVVAVCFAGLPLIIRAQTATTDRLTVALPNHLAVAPLVAGADWVLQAATALFRDYDMVVSSADTSPESGTPPSSQIRLRIRAFTTESDEEIISLATRPRYRAHLTEKEPDVIVTDLISALIIIHRVRMKPRFRTRYRLHFAIGAIPWRAVRRRQTAKDAGWHLAPGHLPYSPSRTEIAHSPLYSGVRHLPAAYGSCSLYGLQSTDVAQALVPEPYASLIEAKISGQDVAVERLYGTDGQDASPVRGRRLAGLYEHLPYVVLVREPLRADLDVQWQHLRRSLLTGIDRLRQDLYVIDVTETRRIATFLNWSPGALGPLDLPTLNKALMASKFGTSIDPFDFVRGHELELSEFMKELRLLEGNQALNPGLWRTENIWPDWYHKETIDITLGHRIESGSEAEKFLAPLIVVWAANTPGKLSRVLEAIQDLDLLFVDTSNVGEHGLIYMFPKSCLPAQLREPTESPYELLTARPLDSVTLARISSSAARHQCLVREVQGLLLGIKDAPGGLLGALHALQSDHGDLLNLEGVHAFPLQSGRGMCFVMMKEADLKKVIDVAIGRGRVAR